MNREALTAILDVKSAEMDVKARELQVLRDHITQMRAEAERLQLSLHGQGAPATSVQDMQINARWFSNQLDRMRAQTEAIIQAEAEEHIAEEALRVALGEKRGIEHLLDNLPRKRRSA